MFVGNIYELLTWVFGLALPVTGVLTGILTYKYAYRLGHDDAYITHQANLQKRISNLSVNPENDQGLTPEDIRRLAKGVTRT